MSDKEKIEQLKKILSVQIVLYKEYTEKEKTGEVDSSYVYDMSCEWFTNLRRGEFCEILDILSD